MRRIMLVLAGLGALAAAGMATATVFSVSITGSGFTPQTITLTRGDTVRWTNNDTGRRRIVADDGTVPSPTLSPGDRYSRAFPDGGTFKYHDAFGDDSFSPVATLTTSDAGAWTYAAHPSIQTAYQAHWKDSVSSQAVVDVRPRVSFRALVGRRFLAKVTAARSFAGRVVNVQRRRSGIWVTLEHVRLGFGSQATFRAPVPRGTSTLRVVITQTQAGAGYLAGISRSIVYHRA